MRFHALLLALMCIRQSSCITCNPDTSQCWELSPSLEEIGDSTRLLQTSSLMTKAEENDWFTGMKVDRHMRGVGKGRAARAHAMRKRIGMKRHNEANTIREMLVAAQADLERRRAPDFIGFTGNGSTFEVPYRINFAGKKGLGAFATEPILQSKPVYGRWKKQEVQHFLHVIPYSMINVAKSVAHSFPKDVVAQLLQWCESNWLTVDDRVAPNLLERGLLCEMDDEHFVNHDDNPNIAPCPNLQQGLCALRDIAAGEELLEDYNRELLDDSESDIFGNNIKRAASVD